MTLMSVEQFAQINTADTEDFELVECAADSFVWWVS